MRTWRGACARCAPVTRSSSRAMSAEGVRARLVELGGHYGLAQAQRDQLATLLAALERDEHAPTAVREPERAVDVHVADSLVALELEPVRAATAIADLGAGAGFPGLPLAVALPALRGPPAREQRAQVRVPARRSVTAGPAQRARGVRARGGVGGGPARARRGSRPRRGRTAGRPRVRGPAPARGRHTRGLAGPAPRRRGGGRGARGGRARAASGGDPRLRAVRAGARPSPPRLREGRRHAATLPAPRGNGAQAAARALKRAPAARGCPTLVTAEKRPIADRR